VSSALAYVRVSSRSQDDALQRSSIEKRAGERGDTIDDWRAEKRSAKTMERVELRRLLAEAKDGKRRDRRLYLFRLDRLTRSGVRDTLNAIHELRAGGVKVVSVEDGLDLEGPYAEIIISVLAFAAKIELLAKNERIAAARDRVEKEGGTWGRPSRFDDKLRAQARTMSEVEGRSVRAIAMALKIPRATVARELARRASQKEGLEEGADSSKDPGHR
jgi:DNA invertase Pin-like site-specific DNA recombinase